MSTYDVVIGSNFGDEGKGLMTDYLANQYENSKIVVRFNGGAQAGHTVVTPEGRRHVFSHFGSGTFAGADTYLSQFFVSNPVLFKKEMQEGTLDTNVYVHPDSIVTTPYEMVLNQFIERKRGKDRHGSCGHGIHETIKRHEIIPFTVKDLTSNTVLDTLFKIREYCKMKAHILDLSDDAFKIMDNPMVIKQFIEDIISFDTNTVIADIDHLERYEHIIFEGAQGLLLDQDHEYFPHVTHSKTGMFNVNEILEDLNSYWEDDFKVNVYYMTRGYMTRHGAGPFKSEIDGKPYDTIYDKTNIHNEWQQNLRFGYLDLTLLFNTIEKDSKYKVTNNIVATCMDQLPDVFKVVENGHAFETTKSNFYHFILASKFKNVYISEGETRSTITNIGVNDE